MLAQLGQPEKWRFSDLYWRQQQRPWCRHSWKSLLGTLSSHCLRWRYFTCAGFRKLAVPQTTP